MGRRGAAERAEGGLGVQNWCEACREGGTNGGGVVEGARARYVGSGVWADELTAEAGAQAGPEGAPAAAARAAIN